jgi:hypothetical protein
MSPRRLTAPPALKGAPLQLQREIPILRTSHVILLAVWFTCMPVAAFGRASGLETPLAPAKAPVCNLSSYLTAHADQGAQHSFWRSGSDCRSFRSSGLLLKEVGTYRRNNAGGPDCGGQGNGSIVVGQKLFSSPRVAEPSFAKAMRFTGCLSSPGNQQIGDLLQESSSRDRSSSASC